MIGQILWTPGISLDAMEKLIILEAYRIYHKNKTATANSLGIAIRTLDQRLERYELEEERERQRLENVRNTRTEQLSRARGNPPNNIGMPYNPLFEGAQRQALGNEAHTGVRLESIANSSSKHELPMQKREEIQTLPSKSSPPGHKTRFR